MGITGSTPGPVPKPAHEFSGCLESPYGKVVMIIQNLPWDGASGGRVDAIERSTDRTNENIPRGFLSRVMTLPHPNGECSAYGAAIDFPSMEPLVSLIFFSGYSVFGSNSRARTHALKNRTPIFFQNQLKT